MARPRPDAKRRLRRRLRGLHRCRGRRRRRHWNRFLLNGRRRRDDMGSRCGLRIDDRRRRGDDGLGRRRDRRWRDRYRRCWRRDALRRGRYRFYRRCRVARVVIALTLAAPVGVFGDRHRGARDRPAMFGDMHPVAADVERNRLAGMGRRREHDRRRERHQHGEKTKSRHRSLPRVVRKASRREFRGM